MKLTPAIVQIATLAALGLSLALLFRQCGETSKVKAAAAKQAEAATLDKAGIQRAREVAEKELRERGDFLLKELVASLEKQGIKSKPAIVIDGTTGPVPAGGATLGSGTSSPGSPQAARDSGADGTSAASGSCLLSAGDQAEIRTKVVGAETIGGNLAVSGRADAYALDPERHLFGGDLRLDVAIPSTPPPASKHGWGLGGAVALNGGLGGRVVVLPPPVLGFESFASIDVSRSGTVDRPAIGIFRRF